MSGSNVSNCAGVLRMHVEPVASKRVSPAALQAPEPLAPHRLLPRKDRKPCGSG